MRELQVGFGDEIIFVLYSVHISMCACRNYNIIGQTPMPLTCLSGLSNTIPCVVGIHCFDWVYMVREWYCHCNNYHYVIL